jgi:hypothetical protein
MYVALPVNAPETLGTPVIRPFGDDVVGKLRPLGRDPLHPLF